MNQERTLDVVSIGAANMDIIARVQRFPDVDDQVPVQKLSKFFGGSATNTAITCGKLGLNAGFIGRIGADATGEELMENFMVSGINLSGIIRDMELPSGQVFIVVSQDGDRMMYAYPGAPQALIASDIVDQLSYLGKTKIIHIASLKAPEPFIEVAKHSLEMGYILSFNPGSMLASLGYDKIRQILDHADIIICSRYELCNIFGSPDVEACVSKYFSSSSNVKMIVVTYGARGSGIFIPNESTGIIPAFKVDVVDTTGGGDAYCGALLYKVLEALNSWLKESVDVSKDNFKLAFHTFMDHLAEDPNRGDFLEESATFANAVASFVVRGEGAQSHLPSYQETMDFIAKNSR